MVLIPYGLVAKSKSVPLWTILIVLGTSLYSFLNFSTIQKAETYYWNSQSRLDFARSARNYVIDKCNKEQASTFCEGIESVPLRTYLFTKSNRPTIGKIKNTPLIDYIIEELDPVTLEKNSPDVYRLHEVADHQLIEFSKNHQLLSINNIQWLPILRSQFIHANYFHLGACLLIFLFLAFPLEERLGFFFFPLLLLASGIVGSVTQVSALPSTFYCIGLSPALAGLAGAYFILFLHNFSVVLLSLFFLVSKKITLPSSLFAITFGVFTIFAGGFDPIVSSPHLAHVVGFFFGLILGGFFKIASSIPDGFTYSYEFKYLAQTKKNLSQYHRIKVLAEWLYHCPLNIQAFRELASEASRSDSNPKVKAVLNRFREHAFPDIYKYNKRKTEFFEHLPLQWLTWVPVNHRLTYLENLAEKFVQERNFKSAFKVCFIILNHVGWSDEDWKLELFKNYKRASVDKNFKAELKILRKKHTPLGQAIKQRAGFEVTSA